MVLQKAWMDDQLLYWIFAVNFKKSFPVFLVIGAHARLNGNLHPCVSKDLVQKTVKLFRFSQKSGPFSLGCYGS